MKCFLKFLMAVLILTACSNDDTVVAHKNIGEEVMNDANQVIAIIDKGRETDEIPDPKEFSSFINKYSNHLDDLTSEEFELVMAAMTIAFNTEEYFNGTRDFLADTDKFYKTMETGEFQSLTNDNNKADIQNEIEDTEQKLYINMINMLMAEFDEKYDEFDIEAGTHLFKLVKGIANKDIDAAKNMKDSILDKLPEKQKETYSHFYDKVIELEETFSHLEWSESNESSTLQ